jgi:DNA-binding response OmpR family regulator
MNHSASAAVGVFNTSPDTVEMLRIVLERAGFVVVSAYTFDLRDAKIDIEVLVRQHQPKVIIYDVAPPYDRNWRLFEHMRAMPALAGIEFIVTTTNVGRVRDVAGPDQELFEIVGKPYDLDQIVAAVKARAQRGGAEAGIGATSQSASQQSTANYGVRDAGPMKQPS